VENVLFFGAKSNRRYRRLTLIIRACALRVDFKFDLGYTVVNAKNHLHIKIQKPQLKTLAYNKNVVKFIETHYVLMNNLLYF